MRRKRLRKKEAKKVSAEVKETAGVDVEGNMDEVDFGNIKVILVDNEPLLINYEGRYYLSVYGVMRLRPEKYRVTVDEGALKFIMNGADVMKPGIVYADERIKEGDFVFVTVEGKDSPIAVGLALCDGSEMIGEKGKAVKNIHHLKDKIWKQFFG
ncbi:MAG: pseudouridine synthase [Archaeoglobus sp.]|uniref:PUA domain-containing protein n=1 Tax=Archaeoglobus sp. TaxID=1872626 RepID=UPI001D6229F7|nr:PUA domain-containing protein [Archaeoglobus sp.]MBO8179704.1 pseudouridine synthase [Archaeoglobus sp.]